MQLSLIAIGATSQPWVKEGVDMYNKRLHRYTKYQYIETPNLKGKHAKADPVRVMKEGMSIKVIASDPSTKRDIPKFCSFLRHTLIGEEHDEKNQRYTYEIRKGTAG